MKKILLTVFLVASTMYCLPQSRIKFNTGLTECVAPEMVFQEFSSNAPLPPALPAQIERDGRSIVLRQMGTSGNGFGFLGTRQFLWADQSLNAISFIHRMNVPPQGPGSGFLAYDYSLDGGQTWNNNIQVYNPTVTGFYNARYPQHGLYNPIGNTNPANAYLGYFAANLDGSNGGTWGGYSFGTHQFSTTSAPTQHVLASSGSFLQGVPSAYTITSQGMAICVDAAKVDSYLSYTDYMIITKGQFNPATGDFDMERFLEYMPAGGVSPVSGSPANVPDVKVAFAPDGMTGYIGFISNNGENTPETDGCYYPILYKTTDGGETWDGPYNVPLGGPNGLPVVLNYLRDELIQIIFQPPYPNRDEIPFTSAFEFNMTVDYAGNPHLIFDVGVGNQNWSIYTSHTGAQGCDGMVAMIHVFSTDGGTTWYGNLLQLVYNFRGEFPYTGGNPVAVDNRPYVASTMDGSKLFFSWLDTDLEGYGSNDQPNIYCVGYDVASNKYTEVKNVSQFSAAWYNSFMGAGSKYVLALGNGNYKIPFVFQQINPLNLLDPVQFWFIDNFIIHESEFVVSGVQPNFDHQKPFSRIYPNPARGYIYIDLTMEAQGSVNIVITDLSGRKILDQSYGQLHSGDHHIRLDLPALVNGIYQLQIVSGRNIQTHKLVVK